jgi:hypothetical protein
MQIEFIRICGSCYKRTRRPVVGMPTRIVLVHHCRRF